VVSRVIAAELVDAGVQLSANVAPDWADSNPALGIKLPSSPKVFSNALLPLPDPPFPVTPRIFPSNNTDPLTSNFAWGVDWPIPTSSLDPFT